MIRLIYSLTYLNARSAWRGAKGRSGDWMAAVGWLGCRRCASTNRRRQYVQPFDCLAFHLRLPTTRCCGSHGESLWEFHGPAIFTSDARKRVRNSDELAPILSLRHQCLSYREIQLTWNLLLATDVYFYKER